MPKVKALRVIQVQNRQAIIEAFQQAERLEGSLHLTTPYGAVAYAGARYFLNSVEEAKALYPAANVEFILDCGDSPGYALAALRAGAKRISLTSAPEIVAKIKAIAKGYGAVVTR